MSATVPVEVEKPKQSGVTFPTTPEAQHDAVINRVQTLVRPQVPNFDPRPPTIDAPMPTDQTWPMDTEIIGSTRADIKMEEQKSKSRDIKNHILDFISKFKGGHTDKRAGQAGGIGTRGVFGRIKDQIRNRGKIDYSSNELE